MDYKEMKEATFSPKIEGFSNQMIDSIAPKKELNFSNNLQKSYTQLYRQRSKSKDKSVV